MSPRWTDRSGRTVESRTRGPLFRTLAYEKAEQLLLDQKARLEKVIAENAFPCTTNQARRYLAHVVWWLNQPAAAMELAPLKMGPNGDGPAIDALCREAESHRKSQDGLTIHAGNEGKRRLVA